jgi:small subunit ribosomal protein S18
MARKTQNDGPGRKSASRRSGEGFVLRKRSRHLENVRSIDPSDWELLRRFLTDHGKIIPARLTGASAKQQRQIKRAIRRARVMGLLP